MEVVMEKVYEIGGLPHFQTIKEEVNLQFARFHFSTKNKQL